MEVKGDLTLKVNDPSMAFIKIGTRLSSDSNVQYKVCHLRMLLVNRPPMFICACLKKGYSHVGHC
jgi:coatomer subunit delta